MSKQFIIIGLGNVKNLKEDIQNLAIEQMNFAESSEAVFCTFPSDLSVDEMRDQLAQAKRGYFIFELVDGGYSFHLGNQTVEDLLFKGIAPNALNDVPKIHITDAVVIDETKDEIDYSSLKPQVKEEMINKIIDKGAENLTPKDKEMIQRLSK